MRLRQVGKDKENMTPAEMLALLEIRPGEGGFIGSLPFVDRDTTAGTETELQAVVAGKRDDVDLPRTILESNYFANIVKRAAAGDTSRTLLTDLERFLGGNAGDVWENSWVRFSRRALSDFAYGIFRRDLLRDKCRPELGLRGDASRFFCRSGDGEEQLRLPVSYLIKLSLAEILGSSADLPASVRETGERLMGHYLNDNTSPETFSFYVVPLDRETGMGRAVARETAKRFLLTQLLLAYANQAFRLKETGQAAAAYFAPHPPVRQRELNSLISDSFYRELFMSPCLSGWDRGEEKFRYMQLCHETLSRSQLNGVAKLREAGIVTNNLIVMPTLSNVSLANNGTHISLGSRRLTRALGDAASGFTAYHEKHLGDLAIKMTEHFLPLFVGTYSAAPYRLGYTAFHPELALGFLPHELDYTHLRMLWRRWQKKAEISVFGRPITPFGPEWLDNAASRIFHLRGDFVPDYRLIDYLVAPLSTERSPALDGRTGGAEALKKDLADLGIFDRTMSLYLLCKLREFGVMGFSGFEGRHYSLFEDLEEDLGGATELQTLVTALAFKLMAEGKLQHEAIPDDPAIESERRQIFFAAAIGVPTFYVRKETRNFFLRRILALTVGVRDSRRYPGYLRVKVEEYRKGLLLLLRQEGEELIEAMNLSRTVADLQVRLGNPDLHSAAGKLTRGILETVNARVPMRVPAREFNAGAELYYRETLRRRHLAEGLAFLEEDALKADAGLFEEGVAAGGLAALMQNGSAVQFVRRTRRDLLDDKAPAEVVAKLVAFCLLTICHDTWNAEREHR